MKIKSKYVYLEYLPSVSPFRNNPPGRKVDIIRYPPGLGDFRRPNRHLPLAGGPRTAPPPLTRPAPPECQSTLHSFDRAQAEGVPMRRRTSSSDIGSVARMPGDFRGIGGWRILVRCVPPR